MSFERSLGYSSAGYKGHRFEVRAIHDGKEMVYGWTDNADGGALIKSCKCNPAVTDSAVLDMVDGLNFEGVWPLPTSNGFYVAHITWPLDDHVTTRWAAFNIKTHSEGTIGPGVQKRTVNDKPHCNMMTVTVDEYARVLRWLGRVDPTIKGDKNVRLVNSIEKLFSSVFGPEPRRSALVEIKEPR